MAFFRKTYNLSLVGKILLSFRIISLIVILFLVFFSFILIHENNIKSEKKILLVKQYSDLIELINQYSAYSHHLKLTFLKPSEQQVKNLQDNTEKSFEKFYITIETIGQSIVYEEQGGYLDELILNLKQYRLIVNELITVYNESKDELFFQILKDEDKAYIKINKDLHEIGYQITSYINNLEENSSTFIDSFTLTFAIIIFVLLIIVNAIQYMYQKRYHLVSQKISSQLKMLHQGEIPRVKLEETSDDIGDASKYINKISEYIQSLVDFVSEIIKGNYKAELLISGNNDEIGSKIVELKDNLQSSRQEEEKRKLEDEQRNWANRGLAKFAEILRHSSDTIGELAGNIIQNCVKYLDSNQGGLFLYNDDNREDIKIELIASYAYDRKKFIEKTFALGEGLIGQCALEKKTMYLDQIPEDYMKITSGFGSTEPKYLLIVPLKIEETILGVLELASLIEFKQYQVSFVERLAESIAVSLSTARINARTVYLYEESKRQSSELSEKEEEMRQNLEEMKATQEQAMIREVEMKGILMAIDNTLIKCEYDTDGNFMTANARYLEIMEYKFEELIGRNVRMFVPGEKLEKFNLYWKGLLEGKPYSGIIERKTRTGEIRWLLMSYTPVKDHDDNIFKILFLANDITEFRQHEERAQAKVSQLTKQNEEIKREFEITYDKVKEKLTEEHKITEIYEGEMQEMYKSWMENLKNAENIQNKIDELNNTIDKQNESLKESESKINELQEEIKISADEKIYSGPVIDDEIGKKYEKWLKTI